MQNIVLFSWYLKAYLYNNKGTGVRHTGAEDGRVKIPDHVFTKTAKYGTEKYSPMYITSDI